MNTEQHIAGRYENLDGLRVFACVGIVLMHVLGNGDFGLRGFVFERLIPSFTNFTYLFMLLSAFSLCCGYFSALAEGRFDPERFYRRRYARIWPCFAILCAVELLARPSLRALYDFLADLSLAFGLIPAHGIEVIGVGWFLGVLFVFYMIFPFFAFLMMRKGRAWLAFGAAVALNALCRLRFPAAVGRVNFIYCAMFFAAGGLLWLYRERFTGRLCTLLAPALALLAAVFFFTVSPSDYTSLVLFSLLTISAIACEDRAAKVLLQNRAARFLSSISLEIYLCHMAVFRVLEKLGLVHALQRPALDYALTSLATLLGAVTAAYALRRLIRGLESLTRKRKKN